MFKVRKILRQYAIACPSLGKVNQGLVKDWNQVLRETGMLNDIHTVGMAIEEP